MEALVVPSAVSAWLGDVERRLDAFEGKTVERESAFGQVRDAERLDGPTDERASVDEGLAAAVAADRRALGRIAERVDVLAARAGVAGGADDGPADGER